MQQGRSPQTSILSRLMPDHVTRWTRAMAWASMIANGLLIVTGGAVRLTASGLGCPTWPRCTDESWTNTPEMGIHGYIEFGNRLLTFVLVIIAVLTFLSVVRLWRTRRDLFVLALVLALGIPLQAIIGGITVRTGLNPWVVGIHFVLSAVLVALAAILVNRTRRASLPAVDVAEGPGQFDDPDRSRVRWLAGLMGVSAALTIYVGTLVTGTGPHSGDSGEVARHAFDPYVIARLHVVPVYVLVGATVAALFLAMRGRWPGPILRSLQIVGLVLAVQAAVGYYQWFNGVPVLAVAIHMAGSAFTAATVTMAVEKMVRISAPRPPDFAGSDADAPVASGVRPQR
ncbi:MAG: COX15/CtaA family protein [Mobilicoccus sp.]|nr:COX15/CtaA family protein [Mobilicoccus sp.]